MSRLFGRQLGHTFAAIKGVKDTGAILVCVNDDSARYISSKYNIRAISISDLDKVQDEALVFDNATIEVMVQRYEKKIASLIEQQVEIIENTKAIMTYKENTEFYERAAFNLNKFM